MSLIQDTVESIKVRMSLARVDCLEIDEDTE